MSATTHKSPPYSTNSSHRESLLKDLNALLTSLSLPFTLLTPYDLTPSLLVLILESLLHTRLPLTPDWESRRKLSRKEEVEAMKVFLGVLEHDVFQADVGLSDVDPRRLAKGEWEEVVGVGEVLCWLGKVEDEGDAPVEQQARCIHQVEVEHPSFFFDSEDHTSSVESDPPSASFNAYAANESLTSFCDCSKSIRATNSEESCDCSPSSSTHASVRYQGFIQPVDVENEIRAFEAQPRSPSRSAHTPIPTRLEHSPTRDISPTRRTLTLLNERARLLDELAELKLKMAETSHC